jgi:uncharacterized protein
MAELKFEDLSFLEKDEKVVLTFLDFFYFELSVESLKKIAPFKVHKKSITFDCSQERASHRFQFLMETAFSGLKNKVTGRKTIYVHKNSGIPLIGTNYFGIVDRGTSLIEIKPVTGCNLNCCYCSVDEGISSKTRLVDFLVEKDYLVSEIKKVIQFKETDEIEIHIGTQGEPLIYKPLPSLIKELRAIPQVSTVSMDTNGVLLTEKKVDELVKAGLTRFNLSINAIDRKKAREIAGSTYDIEKIIRIAEYIAKNGDIILTPVWIPGVNDSEIPKIIEFAIKIGGKKPIGIQNYLQYNLGRNPVKEKGFDEFYLELKELESKYSTKLIQSVEDYNIRETKELAKPFKKGFLVRATVVCEGRFKNEMLAAAGNRLISFQNIRQKVGSEVKIRINHAKHNIFSGTIVF